MGVLLALRRVRDRAPQVDGDVVRIRLRVAAGVVRLGEILLGFVIAAGNDTGIRIRESGIIHDVVVSPVDVAQLDLVDGHFVRIGGGVSHMDHDLGAVAAEIEGADGPSGHAVGQLQRRAHPQVPVRAAVGAVPDALPRQLVQAGELVVVLPREESAQRGADGNGRFAPGVGDDEHRVPRIGCHQRDGIAVLYELLADQQRGIPVDGVLPLELQDEKRPDRGVRVIARRVRLVVRLGGGVLRRDGQRERHRHGRTAGFRVNRKVLVERRAGRQQSEQECRQEAKRYRMSRSVHIFVNKGGDNRGGCSGRARHFRGNRDNSRSSTIRSWDR